jgi:predicted nucleic acid-binding Zn ribbon protein
LLSGSLVLIRVISWIVCYVAEKRAIREFTRINTNDRGEADSIQPTFLRADDSSLHSLSMDELIKSLPTVLRAAGSSHEVAQAAALAAWKHATGAGLQSHAIATRLDDRTLIVEVRDPIWQKQLQTMKEQLLFRVNTILGQALVTDIELRVNPKAVIVTQQQKIEASETPDNEVPLELWSAASAIQDKQLRQKFLKTAMVILKRKSGTDLHG